MYNNFSSAARSQADLQQRMAAINANQRAVASTPAENAVAPSPIVQEAPKRARFNSLTISIPSFSFPPMFPANNSSAVAATIHKNPATSDKNTFVPIATASASPIPIIKPEAQRASSSTVTTAASTRTSSSTVSTGGSTPVTPATPNTAFSKKS